MLTLEGISMLMFASLFQHSLGPLKGTESPGASLKSVGGASATSTLGPLRGSGGEMIKNTPGGPRLSTERSHAIVG